ncbi:MAG: SMC family ATPase [Infirmifilum sp.]
MVVIRSLKAINFRRLNIPEPLNLDKGIFIIRGRNEAGKSTFIEAILFGLYGDHQVIGDLRGNPRRGYAEVVNHRSRKALVEVEFEVDNRRYRVARELIRDGDSIKQVNARLVEITEGSERLLATGVKPVNDEVHRILKVSWKEMLTTNIVAQKDLERIIHLNKGDREQIINLMMGLESYNRAISSLEDRRREANRKKEGLAELYEEKRKRVEELKLKLDELPGLRSELQKIEEQLPGLRVREELLKKALDYLTALRQVLLKKKELEHQEASLEDRIVEKQGQLSETQKRINTNLKSLRDIELLLPQLLDKDGHLRQELQKLREEYDARSRLFSDIQSYNEYRTKELKRIEELDREIRTIEEEVRHLEQSKEEITLLEKEKSALKQEISTLKIPSWSKLGFPALGAGVLALLLMPQTVIVPIGFLLVGGLLLYLGYRKKIMTQQALLARASAVEVEISSKAALVSRLDREKKRLEDLVAEKAELEKHVKDIEDKIRGLGGRESTLPIEEALNLLKRELERQREQIERLEGEEKTVQANIEVYLKEQKRLKEETEQLQKKLLEIQQQLKELEERKRKVVSELNEIKIPPPPSELKANVEYVEIASEEQDSELVDQIYEKLNWEYHDISVKRAGLEKEIGNLRKRIEETELLRPQLEQLQGELEKLGGELAGLEKELKAIDKAIRAMQEISRKRREAFAPSVEQYISWVIGYFTNGRYKAVRLQPDTYDLEVYDSEAGRWLVRDIYSGGTNDQFLLALRIAFTLALLPSAKGSYPKFLVLDEPLGSSDAERRERIISFFTGELVRFFDQVFLITHVEIEEPPGVTIIQIEDGKVVGVHRSVPEES